MIHSFRAGICHYNLGNAGKKRTRPNKYVTQPVQGNYSYPITKSASERVHLF